MPKSWVNTNRWLERLAQVSTPDYDNDIHDPFLLSDMSRAVERINRAVAEKEKIIIFSDYDADGVPGAVILSEYFRTIGYKNFGVYIPDRHTEEFGLSEKAIRQLADGGAQIIITVDCGITDVVEVALAQSRGVDVIITDHHLPPDPLPPAFAIINPKCSPNYPEPMLCGSGVVFKLVQALTKNDEWTKWLLDLVAVATVADMVPITGENRALVYFGLKVLRRTRRFGLLALFDVLKLNREYITEDDIGFMIGPRLNAASRMSHASEAYELLTTNDSVRARAIAEHLEHANRQRRALVDQVLSSVPEPTEPILVFGNADWSPTILGLAASRLMEKYRRPVFLWGNDGNGGIKGSCRSDGSVNVVELMCAADCFSNFGGHTLAGGYSMLLGREVELNEKLNAAYSTATKAEVSNELILDAELSLDEVNDLTFQKISTIAPFGLGNPKPVFLFRNLSVTSARTFGNGGAHLELIFDGIPAISFFWQGESFQPGQRLDLAATLEKSYFRHRPQLRLRIVDIFTV